MDTAAAPPNTLSRTAFAIIFSVSMIIAVGNTGLQSVMPAIARQTGIPDALAVGAMSLSALLWTFTSPFWARASDTRGRKPLILVGMAGFSLSMLACGAAVFAGLHGWLAGAGFLGFFMLARAIFGAFGSAANPATQAYIAERTSRGERTHAMAVLAGAFGLGTVIGPAVAPFLVLPFFTLSGPMFLFAAMGAALIVVVVRCLPGSARRPAPGLPLDAPRESAWRADLTLWGRTDIQPFLIYAFVLISCQTAQMQTLGFFVIDKLDLPPLQAQGFIAVALMAGALTGLLAQWGLIRMFGLTPRLLLRLGAGIAAGANLIAVFAPSYWTIVISYAIACLGYAFARPGFTAGASLAAGMDEQARVAGAIAAVLGVTMVMAAIAVVLYQFVRWLPFAVNAAVLSALLVYALKNKTLREAGEDPTDESATAAATRPEV